MPEDDDIRDRARELHENYGDTDIDLDAEISRYSEGAYVQARVWVPFEAPDA